MVVARPVVAPRERRHADDRARLQAMMDYAESKRCRFATLRRYFGEADPTTCGGCGNCRDPLHGVAAARHAGTSVRIVISRGAPSRRRCPLVPSPRFTW